MPNIKDFDQDQQDPAGRKSTSADGLNGAPTGGKKRRRPGRESDDVGATQAEAATASKTKSETPPTASFDVDNEAAAEKFQLEFYGSDLLKQKLPKAFALAETVADEWVHDGRFEGLPVGHPLAQVAASYGLRKAKTVEKKLEEKGVFMMARMGVEYAKTKLRRR